MAREPTERLAHCAGSKGMKLYATGGQEKDGVQGFEVSDRRMERRQSRGYEH